jgi:hypothetical protein
MPSNAGADGGSVSLRWPAGGWPAPTPPAGRHRGMPGPRDDLRSGRSPFPSAIMRAMIGAEFAWWYSLMITTAADLPHLTDVLARPAWQAQAACRGVGVEVFFPERGESTAPAKALCATCPVTEPCRQYAIAHTDVYGVWGGTSTQQRSVLRSSESEPAR